jgi:4-hydroxy-tetrahydrodipicolinate synthase
MFTGCGTALVTPFKPDLSLDVAATRRLIQRQIREGIDFLVPCGTTGESPTLTREEHLQVVLISVEETRKAGRQVPVLAGCGGYNTAEVIELAKELQLLGVDGLLSVTPYYNKVTQDGLYRHYKAIADAVPLPIVVYNVPGRTGVNVETATLKRLSEIEHICGVKEASGNISQIAAACRNLPDTFDILSGDDTTTIPLCALGGRGVISVVSNEIPGEMTKLTQLAVAGDFAGARAIQRQWFALMEVNFAESNPIPVKAAMAMMGLCEPVYRLPMCPPLPQTQSRIEAVLKQVGLLAGALAGAGNRNAN